MVKSSLIIWTQSSCWKFRVIIGSFLFFFLLSWFPILLLFVHVGDYYTTTTTTTTNQPTNQPTTNNHQLPLPPPLPPSTENHHDGTVGTPSKILLSRFPNNQTSLKLKWIGVQRWSHATRKVGSFRPGHLHVWVSITTTYIGSTEWSLYPRALLG